MAIVPVYAFPQRTHLGAQGVQIFCSQNLQNLLPGVAPGGLRQRGQRHKRVDRRPDPVFRLAGGHVTGGAIRKEFRKRGKRLKGSSLPLFQLCVPDIKIAVTICLPGFGGYTHGLRLYGHGAVEQIDQKHHRQHCGHGTQPVAALSFGSGGLSDVPVADIVQSLCQFFMHRDNPPYINRCAVAAGCDSAAPTRRSESCPDSGRFPLRSRQTSTAAEKSPGCP